MSKTRDIKKGLQGLQLNQAMKLKGGSLSLTPPVVFATGVSNAPTDTFVSVDKISPVDENLSQVKSSTPEQIVSKVSDAPMEQKQSWDSKQSTVEVQSVDVIRAEVKNASQVLETSRDENLTMDRNLSKNQSTDQNSPQRFNLPRDEEISQVQNKSMDYSVSMGENEPRIKRGDGSRKATEQDSAVVFAKRESSGLRTGFTRISNEMLLDILEGDLSKSEIKILLLISRFTTSFQKEFAPMSKAVIERYTHLQGKSVLDAMTGLEQKQLIQKRRGDERSPNQLALAKKYEVKEAVKNSQNKQPPLDKKISGGEFRGADTFASPFKDNNKYINKYSLSKNSKVLENYFENLKPKAKRDEEFRNFEELNSEFSGDQIQLCLEYLQKHGSLKTGEPCHSPMAYLAKAIGQVLPVAQAEIDRAVANAMREETFQREQKLKRQQEAESERQAHEAQRRFAESFPSPELQEQKLNELIQINFANTVVPRSLLKRIAIQRWFEAEFKPQSKTENQIHKGEI